jgi:hypothetical protein
MFSGMAITLSPRSLFRCGAFGRNLHRDDAPKRLQPISSEGSDPPKD